MVDAIKFRSIDWDDAIELTRSIIQNDERVVELPESLYSEMAHFAESQEEDDRMITIFGGNEDTDIYIVDFTRDPHNYGVFIGYDDFSRDIYLTTGISATQYLIEICYKGAVGRITSAGTLLLQAQAAADYIDADIEYPDLGGVRTRVDQDME